MVVDLTAFRGFFRYPHNAPSALLHLFVHCSFVTLATVLYTPDRTFYQAQ